MTKWGFNSRITFLKNLGKKCRETCISRLNQRNVILEESRFTCFSLKNIRELHNSRRESLNSRWLNYMPQGVRFGFLKSSRAFFNQICNQMACSKETPPEFFLPFFYHVLVPKIGNLLPKTLNICMLFGHFLLSLSSKYHHNYHWTVIMIIGIFSVIRAKRRFWRPKKDVQVARNGGRGGR